MPYDPSTVEGDDVPSEALRLRSQAVRLFGTGDVEGAAEIALESWQVMLQQTGGTFDGRLLPECALLAKAFTQLQLAETSPAERKSFQKGAKPAGNNFFQPYSCSRLLPTWN